MPANSGGAVSPTACNKWQLKISDRGCGSIACGAKATRARIASSRGVTAALVFLLIFTQEVARGLVRKNPGFFFRRQAKSAQRDLPWILTSAEDRRERSDVEEAGIARGIVVLGEQDGARPPALTVRCSPSPSATQTACCGSFVDKPLCADGCKT